MRRIAIRAWDARPIREDGGVSVLGAHRGKEKKLLAKFECEY